MTNEIYHSPTANLEVVKCQDVIRPKSVRVIAMLFFVLAAIDLIFTLKSGLFHLSESYDGSGGPTGSHLRIEILWLLLYGVGLGLMRGGKFARVIAAIIGLCALIIPGAIIIYYLFFTEAANYFNEKYCANCGETKYRNTGFLFKGIKCKQCGNDIEMSNG